MKVQLESLPDSLEVGLCCVDVQRAIWIARSKGRVQDIVIDGPFIETKEASLHVALLARTCLKSSEPCVDEASILRTQPSSRGVLDRVQYAVVNA